MSYAVIRLQEDFFFQIDSGKTLEQPQAQAVNVAAYQYVTPYVRIRTEPGLFIPGGFVGPPVTGGVTFRFYTAATLLEPMEGLAAPGGTVVGLSTTYNPLGTGDRFLYCGTGSDILVVGDPPAGGLYPSITFNSGATRSKTFSYTPVGTTTATGSTIPAITNPGGLLSWKVTNNSGSSTAVFHADIYLVCRGSG